jgi:hypothetical protein
MSASVPLLFCHLTCVPAVREVFACSAGLENKTAGACQAEMHRMIAGCVGRRCHCLVSSYRRRQLSGAGIVRARHQTNASSSGDKATTTTSTARDESHLNWKERTEAPRWMQRIAPTRGGKLSQLKWYEATAIAAGCVVFYWAWFVAEPPSPRPVVAAQEDDKKSSP